MQITAKAYIAGIHLNGEPMIIIATDNQFAPHWVEIGSSVIDVNHSSEELADIAKSANNDNLARKVKELENAKSI